MRRTRGTICKIRRLRHCWSDGSAKKYSDYTSINELLPSMIIFQPDELMCPSSQRGICPGANKGFGSAARDGDKDDENHDAYRSRSDWVWYDVCHGRQRRHQRLRVSGLLGKRSSTARSGRCCPQPGCHRNSRHVRHAVEPRHVAIRSEREPGRQQLAKRSGADVGPNGRAGPLSFARRRRVPCHRAGVHCCPTGSAFHAQGGVTCSTLG